MTLEAESGLLRPDGCSMTRPLSVPKAQQTADRAREAIHRSQGFGWERQEAKRGLGRAGEAGNDAARTQSQE